MRTPDQTRGNNLWKYILVSFGSALLAVFLFNSIQDKETEREIEAIKTSFHDSRFCVYPPLPSDSSMDQGGFVSAAEKTVHGVVHVKTKSQVESYYENPLYEFFYGKPQRRVDPVVSFGSGVIVSEDGYIVTNNHVIENSDEIEVTLNDLRKYDAKLIGNDPSTDLAVLKIEEKKLDFIPWGNSDQLRVGEWVLAVGNPYNLTSTVTAGIVSAKSRNINIIDDKYRIESFIQTDAALNQGNSGGALVNLKGELVGINTAILSPSGSYSGNSFAVPVSIVRKVVTDIIEFGEVQRAILGVTIQPIDADMAKKLNLKEIRGVYVDGVREDGSAKAAGIKAGDIIIQINGMYVNSPSQIQEEISKYRPKDKVTVTILRDGDIKNFDVVLTNLYGSVEVVKSNETIEILGAEFKELSTAELSKLGINGGVKIVGIAQGKFQAAGIKESFIVLKINNKNIKTLEELKQILNNTKGGILIEGIYPNGVIAYYAIGL